MSSRDGNGDEAGWQPTAESRGEADDGSQSPSQDRDMGRSAQSEGAGGGAKGASRSAGNHSGAAAAVDGSGDDDASAAQSFRVKLYEMHPTHGRWEDLGVGRVFVEDNVRAREWWREPSGIGTALEREVCCPHALTCLRFFVPPLPRAPGERAV